jgi:hypothetical protein
LFLGSLLIFGEESGHQDLGSQLTPHSSHQQTVDIGFFEKLINISQHVVYGGDFVSKDPKTTKKKLSLNSTDYVICPARDGCTLTASISSKTLAERKSQAEDLAIVAVRVLVGAMPDLIPRELIIMGSGRSIKLKKNMKRWYDCPLTDEEILLATRNGFVTLWISPCHDLSSAPIIDSVEVYARARADLAFLRSNPGRGSREETLLKSPFCIQKQSSSDMLVSCIQS